MVLEIMRRELDFVKKYATQLRELPEEDRVRLYVETKDLSLVKLLEERYSYGFDLELDLKRVLGKPLEWKPTFEDAVEVETQSQPDLSHLQNPLSIRPMVVSALAAYEGKSQVDFSTLVQFLPYLRR